MTKSAPSLGIYCRRERGRKVYYEIYIDSLLLLNFVMNLYCLGLVNRVLMRTATRKRIIAGALLGAFSYLIPFLLPGSGVIKAVVCFPVSAVVMILLVFRPGHIKAFFHVAGLLLAASFVLGGALLFLIGLVPGGWINGVLGILGIGALVFFRGLGMIRQMEQKELCCVELIGKGARIRVNALWDTGNGLYEPISGKPVCILEKRVFDKLWKTGDPEGFRAIPYHSVGKKQGILYGFLLPEIRVHNNGIVKKCKDIYVGIVEEEIAQSGGYCMILNPALLQAAKQEDRTLCGWYGGSR